MHNVIRLLLRSSRTRRRIGPRSRTNLEGRTITVKASNLKTEYLVEPLGLDIVRPRFSWTCSGGTAQTAYRIVARRGGVCIWDSGNVTSSRMTHIEYEGEQLTSRDRVLWQVELWDEKGVAGEASSTWFELGLLEPSDWQAEWITADLDPVENCRYPVDHFSRRFEIEGELVCARLYVSACGVYEAFINGERVGDFRLAPGSTDYRHRIQYQAYDVLSLLGTNNELQLRLADGWYRGCIGAFGVDKVFGTRTKLICQLEMTFADGRIERVLSGPDFAWSNDGPIRFADLKDGEIVDARMQPTLAGRARTIAEAIVPTASNNVHVSEHERFSPVLVTTPSGQRVLDFGQNIAGLVSFRVTARAGQQLRLRLGEKLDHAGEFTQANFQLMRPVQDVSEETGYLMLSQQSDKITEPMRPTPLQMVEYTCAEGINAYKTEFAVFGFRYALLETDIDCAPEDFTAIAVYSDLAQVGEFTCSNPDINQLVRNARWSMKGNFLDVPTDCPTRERLGWTGDVQAFLDSGAYLMELPAFMRKWLLDVQDGTLASGQPLAVAPFNGLGPLYEVLGGTAGWGDAVALVPYRIWKRYGDEQILRQFYPLMRGYAMYLLEHTGHRDPVLASTNPLNSYVYEHGVQLGEWLEPERFKDPVPTSAGEAQLHTEVATAYLHYTMRILTEIAEQLREPEDAVLFAEYADGAKRAYQQMFLVDGTIDTDRQAKLVRPLALGLLEARAHKSIEDRLALALEHEHFHVGTGFLSTPFLLPVLTGAGHPELAYRVLLNEEAPSWIAQIRAGATTVWEEWEGGASQNHFALGTAVGWLFETVLGIQPAGERHFVIAPTPGGGLATAKGNYASIYGTVGVEWTVHAKGFTLNVDVPPNTTAEVRLPDGSPTLLSAGTHRLSTPLVA